MGEELNDKVTSSGFKLLDIDTKNTLRHDKKVSDTTLDNSSTTSLANNGKSEIVNTATSKKPSTNESSSTASISTTTMASGNQINIRDKPTVTHEVLAMEEELNDEDNEVKPSGFGLPDTNDKKVTDTTLGVSLTTSLANNGKREIVNTATSKNPTTNKSRSTSSISTTTMASSNKITTSEKPTEAAVLQGVPPPAYSGNSTSIALIVTASLLAVVIVVVLVVWVRSRRRHGAAFWGSVPEDKVKAKETLAVCNSLQDLKELRTFRQVHINLSLCHHPCPGDCPRLTPLVDPALPPAYRGPAVGKGRALASPQAPGLARSSQMQELGIGEETLIAFTPMMHLYKLARCPDDRSSSATLNHDDHSTQKSVNDVI